MTSIRFKNLIIYKFTQPFTMTGIELEEKLKAKPFRPCGSQDGCTYGFVPALGRKSTALVHESNGALLMCTMKEEKILPASVIRDELIERVDRIEAEEGRQVYTKEKSTIRDDVIMELLPRAFVRQKATLAYIDNTNGFIIINASSFNQAEELTSCLRECLGSLPIISPLVLLNTLPSHSMTGWLNDTRTPENFRIGFSCKLRESGDDGGTIIAKNEHLESNLIASHIESGKVVSQLGMNWKETLDFNLAENINITGLKFSDLYEEKLEENEADTHLAMLDADFYLMVGTLRVFVDELLDGFGGLTEDICYR